MQLLVTGATGKVGLAFLKRFMADPTRGAWRVIALCHNRTLPETDRLKVVRGSIADPSVVKSVLAGTTHVIHMATVKEDPVQAMDVAGELTGNALALQKTSAGGSLGRHRTFHCIPGTSGLHPGGYRPVSA